MYGFNDKDIPGKIAGSLSKNRVVFPKRYDPANLFLQLIIMRWKFHAKGRARISGTIRADM
jgi:hypothetical protein